MGPIGGYGGGIGFSPYGGISNPFDPGKPPGTSPGVDIPHTGGFDPCALVGPPGSTAYNVCAGIGGLLPGYGGLNPYAPVAGEGAEPGEACPTGYTKVGGTCVANRPGAYLPGGQPATLPTQGTALGTGWEAVQGSFGMPAMTPLPVQRTRLECPAGMVLGKDDLCYPRSTPGLGRRGSFRKWKGDPKPKVSAAEWKTLQRAARTADKIKDVAKEAGFTVKKRGR